MKRTSTPGPPTPAPRERRRGHPVLHLLDEFRRCTESGERCRLVEREHIREKGRLLVELTIEVQA